MQNDNKHQSPYRGFWVVLLALILVPLVLFLIVKGALGNFSQFSPAMDLLTAKVIGLGCGSLFHLICIIGGVFTPSWRAVKYRIGEFFENLTVGVGYAFTTYLEDMREDGVTLLIYLLPVAINLAIVVDSLIDAVAVFL